MSGISHPTRSALPEPVPVLHYRLDGPAAAPLLVLGPSLGTTLHLWDEVVGRLSWSRRVLRFDLPGHGRSPAPADDGALTVADLAAAVLALVDAADGGARTGDRFAYAGVSLGGAVGAVLAAACPDRVSALALVCSSGRFGEPSGWHDRAASVRERGTKTLVEAAGQRWFSPSSSSSAERRQALLDDLAAVDDQGYAACCRALATYDQRGELRHVTAPTLVVAGRDDQATPPEHARELVDAIGGASLVEVAGAAHLACVDQPAAVGAALAEHFDRTVPLPTPVRYRDDAERRAAGMSVRRAVLGDEHVDAAQAATTPATADFQDFITRYAWGEIWTRPGLDRRTRSCVTLTALVAGGHLAELALHVRAALRNGLSPEEISEVLLQAAVYCGVPAANAAFAVARRVLAEQGTPEP